MLGHLVCLERRRPLLVCVASNIAKAKIYELLMRGLFNHMSTPFSLFVNLFEVEADIYLDGYSQFEYVPLQ